MNYMYFFGGKTAVVNLDEIEKSGLENLLGDGFAFDKLEYRCRGTGDQSKSGLELFEGHIIIDQKGEIGVVTWIQRLCQFLVLYNDSDLNGDFFMDSCPEDIEWVEIIGHILNVDEGDRNRISQKLFDTCFSEIKKY